MPRSSSSSSSSNGDFLTAEEAIRDAPLEVLYAGTEYYEELGKETDLREQHRVPYEIVEGLFDRPAPNRAPSPLLVFINSRSGGRAGPELTRAFQRSLGYTQVYDLGTHKPDRVLRQVYANLDKIAASREIDALHMRQALRIVACGGDGTVAWVLQTIGRLGLDPAPPVAVVPLGTGNDLARSFGWGGAFDKRWIKDHAALHRTLGWFGQAAAATLDRWRLRMTAPGQGFFTRKKPYGFTTDGPPEEATTFSAESWNYVSIGMDAKSAFGFHHLRETKPALAFSRAANQAWYGYFSCASGWFCGAEPLSRRMRLEVLDGGGDDGGGGDTWRDIEVGASVKALVLLNLQSYGGGRDLWGDHDTAAKEAGFVPPSNNDGLIEVVGFKSGFHAGAVMSGAAHGVRLAQARAVRVHVRGTDEQRKSGKGGFGKVYLQLDGEPWKQDVPDFASKDEMLAELRLQIALEYAGQSQLLVRPGTGNHSTATTAAAAAAEAQHLDKLAEIKASHQHGHQATTGHTKGGAVAPTDDSAKPKAAAGGASAAAARLPPEAMAAATHGASPSQGSELPTPVPQFPTSEDGASPDVTGASPAAAAHRNGPPSEPQAATAAEALGGAAAGAGYAPDAADDEEAAEEPGPVAYGDTAGLRSADTAGLAESQEATMRATESDSAMAMRAPGPQAVLQSVDYGRG